MRHYTDLRSSLCKKFLFLLSSLLLFGSAQADGNSLLSYYKQLEPLLRKNTYGIPVYISSSDENSIMTGSIYGIVNHSFTTLAKAIKPAASWCDIAPLHLNIKACTYSTIDKQCYLTFYSGRKFYEKADDVYQLSYHFKLNHHSQEYIHISMSADEGPVGTSEYLLQMKAIPLNNKQSFIHFEYSYKYGLLASMGMSSYLATLGRGKSGFSISGKDNMGHPKYVGGVRGIIERNTVRYYLAINSYLETLKIKDENRFTARLSNWFEQTEKHHRQLYEMDKSDYIKFKKMERQDQLRLQANIKAPESEQTTCR